MDCILSFCVLSDCLGFATAFRMRMTQSLIKSAMSVDVEQPWLRPSVLKCYSHLCPPHPKPNTWCEYKCWGRNCFPCRWEKGVNCISVYFKSTVQSVLLLNSPAHHNRPSTDNLYLFVKKKYIYIYVYLTP